jgi:hypothetical protein
VVSGNPSSSAPRATAHRRPSRISAALVHAMPGNSSRLVLTSTRPPLPPPSQADAPPSPESQVLASDAVACGVDSPRADVSPAASQRALARSAQLFRSPTLTCTVTKLTPTLAISLTSRHYQPDINAILRTRTHTHTNVDHSLFSTYPPDSPAQAPTRTHRWRRR